MDTRTEGASRNKQVVRDDLAGLNERELLERLLEMTCPSCDEQDIRQAAEAISTEA